MKKYSWIAALLIALTLVFGLVGCDDGSGSTKKSTSDDLPEIVYTGDQITLYAVGNSKKPTVSGNTVAYDGTQSAVTSSGFAWNFPEEVLGKGYSTIIIEGKVVTITDPDFISFNAKDNINIQNDVLIVGHTQQYHNEWKFGTITDKAVSEACNGLSDAASNCTVYTTGSCIVGAEAKAEYPMKEFKKGHIAFQYNPWAGDIGANAAVKPADPVYNVSGSPNFKIEVTKITFPGGKPAEPEPPPPELAVGDVIFDLAAWLVDNDDLGSPFVKAGGPTVAVAAGGITVSDRTDDWNAIDFNPTSFDLEWDKYTFELSVSGTLGTIDSDTDKNILKGGQTGGDYNELGRSTAATTTTGVVTFTGELTEDFGNVRIQTTGTQDYTITAVKLTVKTKK